MKKIGIITIPDYNNYGNRLQNFATKSFFESLGYSVDTLELNDVDFPQYKIRKAKLFFKKYRLRPLIYFFELASGGIKKVKRYKKFQKFTDKHLSVRYCPRGDIESLKKIAADYDHILLGSDQIWHPTVNTTPNLFFASFVDSEKTLFFAPSFGIEKLPREYAKKVKAGLSYKDNLTVREDSGRVILRELLNKEARVLPDPTLCVSPQTWESMAKEADRLESKPYILKYFLGGQSEQYIKEQQRIKDKYNIDAFELARETCARGYITGPSELLRGILDAEYVVTDSFHAVVFSIMLKKPFTVFSRLNESLGSEGLDSRIDILLERFNLQDRKYSPDGTNAIGEMDTCRFSEVLESMRLETAKFFDKIINK